MRPTENARIGTWPTPEQPLVRVVVPARVAHNLEQMQKVTAQTLARLGCTPCHSGFDIRFEMERVFHYNERLELTRVGPIEGTVVSGG